MAEQLSVEVRESLGKRNSRRLRRGGQIPGIVYGHGVENICVSVPADVLHGLIHHGSRLVMLTGGVNESAFIREVQWDTWGKRVTHVDFTRISEFEKVQVQVPVVLRGEAPGVRDGGVVEQLIHEIQIECPAGEIPEKLQVSINALKLLDAITVADLPLPKDSVALADADAIVVHCIVPVEVSEEAAEAVPGEPEVIGAKENEEEEE